MKEGRIRPSFTPSNHIRPKRARAAMKEGRIRPSFHSSRRGKGFRETAAMKEGRIRPSFPLVVLVVVSVVVPQ